MATTLTLTNDEVSDLHILLRVAVSTIEDDDDRQSEDLVKYAHLLMDLTR